jgi:hypothetical protein
MLAMLRPLVTCSADSALSCARAAASVPLTPFCLAKLTPISSSDGWPGLDVESRRSPSMLARPPPDSMMALSNRPRAKGEVSSMCTEPPPADSPNTVTLLASPPKAVMLRFTHFRAAISSM